MGIKYAKNTKQSLETGSITLKKMKTLNNLSLQNPFKAIDKLPTGYNYKSTFTQSNAIYFTEITSLFIFPNTMKQNYHTEKP